MNLFLRSNLHVYYFCRFFLNMLIRRYTTFMHCTIITIPNWSYILLKNDAKKRLTHFCCNLPHIVISKTHTKRKMMGKKKRILPWYEMLGVSVDLRRQCWHVVGGVHADVIFSCREKHIQDLKTGLRNQLVMKTLVLLTHTAWKRLKTSNFANSEKS